MIYLIFTAREKMQEKINNILNLTRETTPTQYKI